MKKIILTLVVIANYAMAQQNRISKYIESNFKPETKKTVLFKEITDTETLAKYSKGVTKCKIVEVDTIQLSLLLKEKQQSLNLEIPFPDNTIHHLKLVSNGFNNHFFDINTSDKNKLEMPNAICYRGIIDNDKNSIAAISFFDNDVIGVLSNLSVGNVNIGKIKGVQNLYVIYFENDMLTKNNFICGVTEGTSLPTNFNEIVSTINNPKTPQTTSTKCIRIYLETDQALYIDRGNSTTNVTTWVIGMFNIWAMVYQNEGLKIEISDLFIWTTPDGYDTNDRVNALSQFTTLRGATFIGDYAHLLSLGGNNIGGYAWIDPLCGSNNRTAYSNIYINYLNLPNFSNTINLISHELGHNLGSHHTHWCGWAGGPIDNCAPVEGACSSGPAPAPGQGTIMSYCYFSGINLANGFGPLPNSVILNTYNTRPCLGSCICGTININTTVTNASCPGIADGAINISATGGVAPYVFGLNDNSTTQNITNLAARDYTIIVGDANLCPKVTTITVGTANQPPTVIVNYVALCSESSVTLTVTGANTYSWSTASTNSFIVVNPSVNTTYTVTGVSIEGCKSTVTSIVDLNNLPTIYQSPTITVNSDAICSGSTLTITASGANTYTWSNNSNNNYIVVSPTLTTTYSVTGTNIDGCKTLTTSIVSVNNTPTISVTSGTVCSGNSTNLSVTGSASSYSWSTNEQTSTILVTPSVSTTYTCIGNTAFGCSTTAVGVVNVIPNPTISVTSGSICAGGNKIITASGASSYLWSEGTAAPSIVVSPTITTSYICLGTNTTGCIGSATATVIVRPLPNLALTSTSICAGASGILQALGANSYSWSTGATSSSITVSPTSNTIYTCTGKTNFGCTKTLTTSVTILPTPIIALTSGTVCYGETATVSAQPALSYTWSNGNHSSSFLVVPNATTVYTCQGYAGSNCPFVSTTTLVVINLSTLTITQNGMTLTSSSTLGNQWYFNGVLIPGATGQSYTATQNGNYSVVVTINDCPSNTANKTILDTGLEDFNLKDVLSIYPNPAQHNLNVSLPTDINDVITYRIYSSNGQLVKNDIIDHTLKSITIRDLAIGLYFIEFSLNTNKASFKFVKE